jgi:hypothetical protein
MKSHMGPIPSKLCFLAAPWVTSPRRGESSPLISLVLGEGRCRALGSLRDACESRNSMLLGFDSCLQRASPGREFQHYSYVGSQLSGGGTREGFDSRHFLHWSHAPHGPVGRFGGTSSVRTRGRSGMGGRSSRADLRGWGLRRLSTYLTGLPGAQPPVPYRTERATGSPFAGLARHRRRRRERGGVRPLPRHLQRYEINANFSGLEPWQRRRLRS